MTVNIEKKSNIIKVKVHGLNISTKTYYFNIFTSNYDINYDTNIITITNSRNDGKHYSVVYNPLVDVIIYNPIPGTALVTLEEHADYLSSFFFDINEELDLKINSREYLIYEQDYITALNDTDIQMLNTHGTQIHVSLNSFNTTVPPIRFQSLNDPRLSTPIMHHNTSNDYNGNYGLILNFNNSRSLVRISSILTSVNINNLGTTANTGINRFVEKVVYSNIFYLKNSINPSIYMWNVSPKHSGTQTCYFNMGFRNLSYRDQRFFEVYHAPALDLRDPGTDLRGVFVLAYYSNSSGWADRRLRLYILNNTPIGVNNGELVWNGNDLEIDDIVERWVRIDMIREYNPITNKLRIAIYIDGILLKINGLDYYEYTISDMSNPLFINSGVMPFIEFGHNNLNTPLLLDPNDTIASPDNKFGFMIDYTLYAIKKSNNKLLDYYNDKINI